MSANGLRRIRWRRVALAASAHFNNLPELKLSLNISADEIRHCADSNKLPINESKSKVLTITGKRLASKINDELVVTVEDNRLVNLKVHHF